MKIITLALLQSIVVFQLSVYAQSRSDNTVADNQSVITLWPHDAPGSENVDLEEHVVERNSDPLTRDRAINHIGKPSMVVYLPEKPDGSAILICPGGGYRYLSYDKEGVEIAKWFNSLGITAFVLKYRLPAEGHEQQSNVPLMDAQRGLRLIRSNAADWGIDPSKIGVIGFSAGGHLASSLGTLYNKKVYTPVDRTDQLSARPDFMLLIYPVISMEDSITHAGSKQRLLGTSPDPVLVESYCTNLQVTSETPQTFIIHASDDGTVAPENSLLFYSALIKAKVPVEMHIFKKGGHGFGLRRGEATLSNWPLLCEKWLNCLD